MDVSIGASKHCIYIELLAKAREAPSETIPILFIYCCVRLPSYKAVRSFGLQVVLGMNAADPANLPAIPGFLHLRLSHLSYCSPSCRPCVDEMALPLTLDSPANYLGLGLRPLEYAFVFRPAVESTSNKLGARVACS